MHNEVNGIKPDFSRYLSTEELAKILKITPQGIRKRLCVTGSFHGVKPLRLVTNRCMWPCNMVELLTVG